MLRSKCRKRNANVLNEGLKNRGIFGNVDGSKKWKHLALPKLLLSWNSTFGRLLAAFKGVK
jgi:hypothetical protein